MWKGDPGMTADFEIIFRCANQCRHSSGAIHDPRVTSCSVAEMKNWIKQRISTEKSPGVFL
jgi:hypothetical protein